MYPKSKKQSISVLKAKLDAPRSCLYNYAKGTLGIVGSYMGVEKNTLVITAIAVPLMSLSVFIGTLDVIVTFVKSLPITVTCYQI